MKKKSNLIYSKIPKITIFLPIYNKEKYITRSIISIQNQTLKNIEIVAINDGSTDNTLKILKKLSKKDNRIKIINNDRNHGLLYSRAMGILNSSGEYVMNLDPDDRLKNIINLEALYNKTGNGKYDLIIFLIERLSTNETNKTENYLTNLENKLQLRKDEYRITNKLIKRKIVLMAYQNFINNIYGNKWNFHEDNIWNLLVKTYSKNIIIFNKYIYLYRRNNQSLNMEIGSKCEIKNRIYRLKTLIKLYKIFKKDKRDYYKVKRILEIILGICNASILYKENDIKKGIINISLELLKIFKGKNIISNQINYNLNKISNNKIIILINSNNKNVTEHFFTLSIFNYLKENYFKKIIFLNIRNNTQFEDIFNYIFPNDIFIVLDNTIFHQNFNKIIKKYYNINKCLLLIIFMKIKESS